MSFVSILTIHGRKSPLRQICDNKKKNLRHEFNLIFALFCKWLDISLFLDSGDIFYANADQRSVFGSFRCIVSGSQKKPVRRNCKCCFMLSSHKPRKFGHTVAEILSKVYSDSATTHHHLCLFHYLSTHFCHYVKKIRRYGK